MHNPITLWTLQPKSVYEALMKKGVYYKTDDHLCIEDFRSAYKWLRGQMIECIGPPEYKETKWPIWTWRYYDGMAHPKPRREYSLLGSEDEEAVFMEISVSEDRILESCFGLWNIVLLDAPISFDDDIEPSSTWSKIFDKTFDDPDWCTEKWENRKIQACLWTIKREDLRSACLLQKQDGRKALKVTALPV